MMKKKLVVNEIFLSINGETTSMGLPTIFIRLAGCNLNCWGGCDTAYALDQQAGLEMSIDEIVAKAKSLDCPRVCLTGGEPLLDTEGSSLLLEELVLMEFEISVETNGAIDLKGFKRRFQQVRFTMDLKPPSSGMTEKMLLDNLGLLNEKDEIKFVIADRKDFCWAVEILEEYKLRAQVLFSPLYQKIDPAKLVEWVLEAQLWSARVQLQLHKYIWSPDKKGV